MASSEAPGRRTRVYGPVAFGVANLATALLLVLGVFRGLPARYLPVDVGAAVLGALLSLAGVGLLGGARFAAWSFRIAKVASAVVLACGLVTIAALAVSVAFLTGVQGALGSGGVVLFVLVIALLVPYLVALPAAQLVWLGRRSHPRLGRSR